MSFGAALIFYPSQVFKANANDCGALKI